MVVKVNGNSAQIELTNLLAEKLPIKQQLLDDLPPRRDMEDPYLVYQDDIEAFFM